MQKKRQNIKYIVIGDSDIYYHYQRMTNVLKTCYISTLRSTFDNLFII